MVGFGLEGPLSLLIPERIVTATLHDRLDLGAMLIALAQGRRRACGLAIAQDQEASRRDPLGQDIAAQGVCGQFRKRHVQRGDDGSGGSGHCRWLCILAQAIKAPALLLIVQVDLRWISHRYSFKL